MTSTQRKPRARWRRLRRLAFRSFLVAAVLVGTLYLLRIPLFSRPLARFVAAQLSAATGGEFTLDRVEGGWISDATLVGLRTLRAPPGAVLSNVSCEEVRLTYRLWGAWSDPLGALRTLDAPGLVVELDGRSGNASSDGTAPDLRGLLDAAPRGLERVTASGAISLRLDEGQASVDRFDLDIAAGRVVLDLGGLSFPLFGEQEHSERFGVVVERVSQYSLRVGFEGAVAGVSPRGGEVEALEDGTLRASLDLDVADGEVRVVLLEDRLSARAEIDLAQRPAWVARALPDAPARGRLAATAEADWRDGEIVVRVVEVHAADLSWQGAVVDDLRVTLRLGEDGTYRGEATAETAGAELRTTDLVLHADAAYGVRAASIALEAPDAGAALRAIGLDDVAQGLGELRTAVAFRGALRAERNLRVAALDVRAPRSSVAVSGEVVLPDRPERWRDAELRLDVAATAALDEIVPLLPAEWELPASGGSLRATGALLGSPAAPRGSFGIVGDGIALDGHEVRELGVEGTFDRSAVRIVRLACDTTFASLDASGDVDLDEGRVDGGRLALDAASLATVSSVFGALPDMAGTIAVRGDFQGPISFGSVEHWAERFDGVTAEFTAEGAALRVGRFEVGALTANAAADWPRVRIARLHADGPLGFVELRGDLDARLETASAEGRVKARDLAVLSPLLPFLPPLAGSLEVQGSAEKTAEQRWREVTARAEVRGDRLFVSGYEVGRLEGSLTADGAAIALTQARARGPWGTADAAGSVRLDERGGSARVDRLRIEADAYPPLRDLGIRPGVVELTRPAPIAWTGDDVTASDIALTVLGGRVEGAVRFGTHFEARLVGEALDLGRLPGDAAGHAGVRIEVAGPPGNADGRLELDVPDLQWEGERGALRVQAAQDARGLLVETLSLDLGETATISGEGRLPFRLTREGLLEVAGAAPPTVQLRAASARPETWLGRVAPAELLVERVELVANAADGLVFADLRAHDLRWMRATPEVPGEPGPGLPGETHLTLRGGGDGFVAAVTGSADGPVRVGGELRIGAPLDWRRLGSYPETLRSAPIGGRLDLDAPDLSALARWVEALVRVSGRARGAVTFGGTVSAPTWEGSLECEDLALRVEGDLPTVGGGSLRLTFDERQVRLERLDAQLGYAPLTASGTLLLGGASSVLDLRLAGENVLLARSPDLRLRADVDLTVTGPLDGLLVRGKVKVTDALYSRAMDLVGGRAAADAATQLFSLRDPPLSDMAFDVHVVADETLRVENNVLDGAFSADVRLRGTGAVPEPEGRIDFRDVRVTLPLTRLRVDRGSLEFPPGNPFDPRIRAGASARMKGYDLNVQLTGTLAATRVQVAAAPALSQEDALLLLATGSTPQELGQEGIGSAALGKAGALLGQTMLTWVSGPPDPDARSLADQLTVEFGREQSRSGASTIEAELELAKRWFLRFERDRYDDYNAGVVWRLRFR